MGTRVNGVDLDAGTSGPALSDATPAALGTAAAGVSTEASRADHVHALPTIPAVSSATPQPLGTATAGVSTEASRADHVHTLPTIPALASTTPAALGVAAVGVGTTAARADHVHALPTIPAVSSATPQPIGTATAGVSDDAARADHVHAPAARTDVDLSSATGWTYDTLGSGSAAVVDTVGETVDLTVGASGTYARAGRAVPWTGTLAPSVRARLAATDATTSAQELGLFFSSALTGAVFVGAVIFGDATVRAVASGAFTAASSVSVPSILGGEGWVRVDFYGATVAVYAGVGVAGAEPTSWTAVGWATSPSGTRQPWEAFRFQLNAADSRTASWDSIRWYDGAMP